MKNKISIIYIGIVAILIIFSCGKKWKETTQMNVSFSFNGNTQNSGLIISSLSINLDKVKFSGQRKQGGNVQFENRPSSPQINFNPSGVQAFSYDIPQGDYTQITMELSYSRPDTDAVITINGIYTDSNHVNKQVLIQIASSAFTSSIAKNSSGGNEIILAKGKTASATITLSPSYWIQTIDNDWFEGADCDSSASTQFMYINKFKNQNIYQNIINRINISPAITIQ